jgi:hypothetical protein
MRQTKATKGWETVQKKQSLHNLIKRIKKIHVGFDDHRQSVFNLIQTLKTLFLYTQSEKDSIKDYHMQETFITCGTQLKRWGIAGDPQGIGGRQTGNVVPGHISGIVL